MYKDITKPFLLFLLIGTLSACGPQTPAQFRQAIENANSTMERVNAAAAMMDFANLIAKNHDQMSAQDFSNWRKQHEVTDRDLDDILTFNAAGDALDRLNNQPLRLYESSVRP